jgi:hypothetical protein
MRAHDLFSVPVSILVADQGWSDETLLTLFYRFIENENLADDLERYLGDVADGETDPEIDAIDPVDEED